MGNKDINIRTNKYIKYLDDIDTLNSIVNDYFLEYFHMRNIDILSEYKSIPNNVYNDAFNYIFSKVFKNDNYTYKDKSILCVNDINILNNIYDIIFIPLCNRYNIISSYKSFIYLTGINENTVIDICRGSKRAGREQVIFFSKLMKTRKSLVQNKLTDSTVGLITLANNDMETGLEYNSKRVIESAAAQVLTVNDLNDKLKLLE